MVYSRLTGLSLPLLTPTEPLTKQLKALLVKKVPTADLEELDPQKADEAALNLSYDQIDDFLEGKEVPQDVSDRLVRIYKATQHKRQPIPTIYD